MPEHISYDRGVLKGTTGEGVSVYMYLDTPGVYLNAFGKEIPEVMAAKAGFAVEKFHKEKLRREKMAAAMEYISQELDMAEREVIAKEGDYSLVKISDDGYVVLEGDNSLTPVPLPESKAKELFDVLAPKKPPASKAK